MDQSHIKTLFGPDYVIWFPHNLLSKLQLSLVLDASRETKKQTNKQGFSLRKKSVM